jgi:death-on-curing protein
VSRAGLAGGGAPNNDSYQWSFFMTAGTTVWLTSELILAIHDEQLAEHGGSTGLRDPGLLDNALARPLNRAGYGKPDIAELAAVYALGIARNHPFVDGNKRTAFVALELFLRLNGCLFTVGDAEAVVMMLAMAAGELPDDEFTAWVRLNTVLPASA